MSDEPHPDGCNCCDGIAVRTPRLIFNRPGLREISYRVGTHAQYKASMLAGLTRGKKKLPDLEEFCYAALPSAGRPDLGGLKTRNDDDFTIALIDAWAVVGDVLSFYIERAANEQYVSTATERRSVADLLHIIGYRLRPGVAAEAWLAFMLETGPVSASGATAKVPGVPDRAVLVAGTQVQSLPGPGETPQTFETVENVSAIAAWNALKPRMSKSIDLSSSSTSVFFAGAALNLNPGVTRE